MRQHAYGLFEIVAWPAAAWCAAELVLRSALGDFSGAGSTALIGSLAASTIVASRWRAAQLRRAPVSAR